MVIPKETVEVDFVSQPIDPLVAVWNLSGGIVHVPPSRICMVVCRRSAESILQSRGKRCKFSIGHIVISVIFPNGRANIL